MLCKQAKLEEFILTVFIEKPKYDHYSLREFTQNNIRILPVFLPVFCVAIMKEYSNIPSLSRLEYEQKSYGIWVYYFL